VFRSVCRSVAWPPCKRYFTGDLKSLINWKRASRVEPLIYIRFQNWIDSLLTRAVNVFVPAMLKAIGPSGDMQRIEWNPSKIVEKNLRPSVGRSKIAGIPWRRKKPLARTRGNFLGATQCDKEIRKFRAFSLSGR